MSQASQAQTPDDFEILIKPTDWLNRPDRGTLLLMGLEQDVLLSAVRRLSASHYRVEVNEREVRTGTVDQNDNPIKIKKTKITYLAMNRRHVPSFVHQFKGLVDHHVLKEARFRKYEADRLSEDLDNDNYYGSSSCEVRSFVKHAKKFGYNLSKIAVAARRKEALRDVVKAFSKIVFEHTNESGLMPTDNDEDFLMYSVLIGVKAIITGDCFITKLLHTLVFSDDESCKFRIHPTTLTLYYPSRRNKRVVCVDLQTDLRAEVHKLQSIRVKQSASHVFLNPNSPTTKKITYNALTKWAGRYSKKQKANVSKRKLI
jgi:hypothetical protein